MNDNDKKRYASNRPKDGCMRKFQADMEGRRDSARLKKTHLRCEVSDFPECTRKNHSTTMADRTFNSYTSADVYKPHKQRPLASKSPIQNSKIMSNDDLYNKIQNNSSSTRTKISSDNSMENRKLRSRRERMNDNSLNIIPNEETGEEFSDSGRKDYEDDEADDEDDFEADEYQPDSQQQFKEYKGTWGEFMDRNISKDEYIELLRRRLRNERQINKFLEANKYHCTKSEKNNLGAREEERRVAVKEYRCSKCGNKTSEPSIQPSLSRSRRTLNSTGFPEDTGIGNFASVSTEVMDWPKLRRSKNFAKHGWSKGI